MHAISKNNKIDKDLGLPITSGRNADIYSWDDNQILKLYKNNNRWTSENIEYERRVSDTVHAAGLPVPAVGELVHINNRTGIIFEQVRGPAMTTWMVKKWWNISRYSRRMAELHFEIHSNSMDADLHNQKELLGNKIKQSKVLTDKLRQKMLDELGSLPDGDRLCHGDFHPRNIIMTDHGETIIDWPNGSVGNPLADVARTTYLTMVRAGNRQSRIPILTNAVRSIHNVYLKHYFTLNSGSEQEYKRWLPVVVAANVRRNMPGLEQWLNNWAETVL